MTAPDPRSTPNQPGGDLPDQDALAVDALPDEVRLHGDADETDLNQTTRGGPEPVQPEEGSGEAR